MSIHNLCFTVKIRKMYTHVHPRFTILKWPFSQNSIYKCIFHGFPCRMIWKMHGCTRKSMDIRVKVSVYTDVHGKSKHSTRKSMESLDIGKN